MFKNLRKKKKGFTLIELIIVIAILAILAAVAIPRLASMTNKAKDSAEKSNIKSITNAATILYAEGDLPADTYEIKADATENKIEAYLQDIPKPSATGTTYYEVVVTDKGKVTVTAK